MKVFRWNEDKLLLLYLAARFSAALALRIQDVAVGWLIYELTASPFALGLVGLSVFLPSLPLSLVTGAVVDTYNRRLVLLVFFLVALIGSVTLVVVASGRIVWPIYPLVACVAVARAFFNPAGQALLADSIPKSGYSRAFAWSSSANESANMIGPAVGGLLYPLGPTVPLAVAAAFFVVATLAAALMPSQAGTEKSKRAVSIPMLIAGYRFIWTTPILLSAMSLDLVAVLLGGATALLPVFARDIFGVGPWGLGLLRASTAAGAIVSSLVIATFPLRSHAGKIMIGCVGIYGLATIGFALSTQLPIAMVFLMALGTVDVISVVIRQTLVQVETPNEMRGRVTSVHNIVTGTANNLGDFESGVMASLLGPVPAVVTGGAAAVIAAVVWARSFPVLWHRDRLAH